MRPGPVIMPRSSLRIPTLRSFPSSSARIPTLRSFASPGPRLPSLRSLTSSGASYGAHIASIFDGADWNVCAAFWLFGTRLTGVSRPQSLLTRFSGLINNLLFVIILSAALDLVGPTVPKAVVLLADVLPSFLTKLTAPFFIHKVPYSVRIAAFATLSTCGMLFVALTPSALDGGSIGLKMAGVVLASLSAGGGELSFLGLTHYYGHFSLAAWGSGTGAAGLVGASAYVLATTTFGLSVRTSLLSFSFLPLIMLVTFSFILPKGQLSGLNGGLGGYESVASGESTPITDPESRGTNISLGRDGYFDGSFYSHTSARSHASSVRSRTGVGRAWQSFKLNLRRCRALFVP